MKRKFTQDIEARRRSREVIGKVPGVRVVPDKRKKKPKHRTPDEYQPAASGGSPVGTYGRLIYGYKDDPKSW